MTLDEAIYILRNTAWLGSNDKRDETEQAVETVVNELERRSWIPCSEMLPELYKAVLVTDGDIIWICELIESPDLDDGEFQWEDKMLGHWYSFDNWDAWMPLPEALSWSRYER